MTASAGRSQNQVPVVDRVDQQPVWSDMTFPETKVVPSKCVVTVLGF